MNRVSTRGWLSILIRAATREQDSDAHYRAENETIFHLFFLVKESGRKSCSLLCLLPVRAAKSKLSFPAFQSTVSDAQEEEAGVANRFGE